MGYFKYGFLLIMCFHGGIHLMGFMKAFHLAKIEQLTAHISQKAGVAWLGAFLLFLITAALYLTDHKWAVPALIAVTISTILVLIWWQDAKYGLIPNVLIFLGAMISLNVSHFEAAYRSDVSNHSTHMHTAQDEELLTQEDLDHLPLVVQRYIEYTGFVGQPKVRDAYVIFNGEMHNRGADWFSFTSEQRNFFEFPGRYFFMKAIYKGLPTHGYHRYELTQASMKVKVLSTIPVVDLERGQLDKAETVTFLNDMCILAPGALIDNRITWREIDKSTVVATYTNDTIVVSAQLEFDDSNRLINFMSDDRMDISDNTFRRFSTPISSYKTFGKYTIGSYGEAVWHYDDGPFVYGKFKLQNIRYNAGIDHIVK